MESDQVILCSFVDNSAKGKASGQVGMYNVRNGQVISPVFHGIVAERNCLSCLDGLVVDGQGHFLAMSPSLSTFQICSFVKEKPVAQFYGHEKIACLSSDEDVVVAGTASGSIFIWQLSTGNLLVVLNKVHFQKVSCICLTKHYIASGSCDGTVKVWDRACAATDANVVPKYSFASHTQAVSMVSFGCSGEDCCSLFTCSKDQSVNVYDMMDGSLTAKFTLPSPCHGLAVDAAQCVLFVGCEDGVVYTFDVESTSSEIAASMNQHGFCESTVSSLLKTQDSCAITSMACSLDNSLLITGNERGCVCIWDVTNRQLIRQIKGMGSVTNIVCLLKSPISCSYSQRGFPQFKRTIDTNSCFLLKMDVAAKSDQNIASINMASDAKLQKLNAVLFNYICTHLGNQ